MSSLAAAEAPSDLSLVVIQLLKGPLYLDRHDKLWDSMLKLRAQVADYVGVLGLVLTPAGVTAAVKQKIQAQPWELAGEGWRNVWKDRVQLKAYGDGTDQHGLNDANTAGVRSLYELLGFDPFDGVSWQNMSEQQVTARLDELYTVRGQIAHTAEAPAGFGINDARSYLDFVKRLAERFDEAVRAKVEAVANVTPWPA